MMKTLFKSSVFTVVGVAILASAGCASVNRTMSHYDRSKVYLQSDRYAAKRITVPSDMDQTSIDDYYPVPTIADQGDPRVPSLVPPKDDDVAKNSKQSMTT